MDISVQNFSDFGGTFADDEEYSNLLGIRGKKYYARKREEQAKATAQVEAQAAAEAKKNAEIVQAEATKKLQEAKMLEAQAKAKVPTSGVATTVGSASGGTTQGVVVDASAPTTEVQQKPKMTKMLIIGGVALVGVIALVMLIRK